ncbi:MAG: DNA-directed RNA polymerase subunit beta [Schaalia hyovaginalis]|uniref:DNA-directed RNA polymerase subunit beta n=1 Tax=Schaalia hyovaginalis TaxID=29316 RepID=UPI001F2B4FE4|nr:DNA-directed RNA polymerase subunit beta [Schaalia hyovaginalis]MCF2711878.1 DNA-directed RNA polymerase subunit beta [Schaalia hyovaginalis]MCI7513484.1 DNA-directed RNA polymerase subunit beta [Schaalia hyovaginalis]MDD7554422.1 DNA-directed RNA polymerase subunit beta [Schaalia hyovaginalis]MDY3093981.1 DNA-directed RNA polymerase subunit beta [Schaalia hyovaginalis]MDY3666356.1 DNA-directed RNA polymerase subunit beta [Schaalia hyovaginalis]
MAASSTANQPRNRISFAKLREPLQAPNLLGLQVESFDWLLGNDAWKARVEAAKAQGRTDVPDVSGLEEIFEEFSPITDINEKMALSFRDHRLERPKYSVEEAKTKDYTYSAPMYITAEFMNYETGEIKSQTVFMGDFPLMTPRGTFIINGTERVVVSQLVRSPGVYFERLADRSSDRETFGAKIIPSRGAWLEFEIDKRDAVGVRIDRKRKQSVTVFLKAIGLTESEIRDEFSDYPVLLETLEKDTVKTTEEALIDIFRKLRPGEPATVESAEKLLSNLYFDDKRYDLAKVGRYKINKKLGLDADPTMSILDPSDIVATVKYLLALHQGEKTFAGVRAGQPVEVRVESDDIDHFGNRRIRAVGELIQAQVRNGLARMERTVRERMTTQEADSITPQSLINIRPVVAAIKEFFGTSQLSQFMDQNNPLAGLTHKRRLSALGPGGLSRDRAGMEVRDVHPSHYGRMCPIESPEGPNIGLIGSLATFARINPFGFIETPYRVVRDGKVTDEVEYLTADDEFGHYIAQASSPLEEDGTFSEDHVLCRVAGEDPTLIARDRVDYMDVSARQMVSVAAAFIPFLEHDDANRALMGANMQRQAVPLLTTEAPLVGTGMERRAASDSGEMIVSDVSGVVAEVSADLIVVSTDEGERRSYRLEKFERSNPGNCTNQRVIVDEGDRVEVGTVLADGPATDNGEVALGKNLLVAYMSWEGLNYEDAIILSRRVVEEDVLTSIHIEEYEVDARETKLGDEEITRDIPNVSEESLADLDERGIIRIGAEVVAGDVLVGKVTPKGETELTSEERLLRAIFGEKAREVRDTSLRVPHGQEGIVIGVREFNNDEDDLNPGVRQTVRVYVAQRRKITIGDKMAGRHGNKGVVSKILPVEDMPFLEDGTPVDIILNPLGVPGRMNVGQVLEYHLGWLAHQGWDASKAVEAGESWTRHLPADGIATAPETLVATPVFDGLEAEELAGLLRNVNPNRDGDRLTNEEGKARLFDGRSGEPFPYPIAVGYTYMLKLHHLVDDKIHARSTGPYSMITQQPLGGKAQFGGQRFGEMEVWALEAYGAAYALQELLTIKSDDTTGRVKVYEAIVKGEDIPEPGIPESFRVLIQEMRSLCLNVEALDAAGNAIDLRDQDEDFNAREDLGITLDARPNAAATIDAI